MAMRPFPAGFRPRRRPGGGHIGPKLTLALTGTLLPGSAFTLTATVTGANPPVTALSAASVTVGGVAVTLSGTGLIRTGTIPADAEEGLAIAAAASIEADGQTISATRNAAVAGEPVAPPLAGGAIPDQAWTVGSSVSLDVAADFIGTGITYALAPSSSALPAGLSLSAAGLISGTPTAEATGTIVVRGTNGGGHADTAFDFAVAEGSAITTNAIVSNRGFWMQSTRSIGATGVMRRGRFMTTQGDVTNLRTVDAGWLVTLGDTVNPLPNSCTFGRFIEYPAGTRHPVTFGGAATGTLVNDGVLVSDVVLNVATGEPLVIPAGSVYWEINTNPTGATQTYPGWLVEGGVGYQMLVDGTRSLDAYSTNIATHGTSTNAATIFSSIFVMGDILAANAKSATLNGDSLSTGWNDQTAASAKGEKGMARIPDALGWGYFNASSRGGDPAGFVTALAPRLAAVISACGVTPSHAIIQSAVNSLGSKTATEILSDRSNMRAAISGMVAGIGFIDTTVTSSVSMLSGSSLPWTLDNQVIPLNRETKVAEFNTAIRARGAAGTSIVWDIADIVMTARDSCRWKLLYPADDGLHITSAGQADIAAQIAA